MLPMSAFAEDVQGAPAADQPTQASLVPTEGAAPANRATEGTRACGMSGGCCHAGGKAKWIVLTGVVGTLVTAAAVGIAVGVARSQPSTGQIPRWFFFKRRR